MNAPYDPRDGSGSPPGPPGGPRYYPPPTSGPASGWSGGGGPAPSPYGDQGGYAYNPYGAYPAGTGGAAEPPAPSRPGLQILALILQIIASLPFLFVGVAFLVVPLNTANLPTELSQLQTDPRFAGTDITPELIVSLVRTIAVIVLVAALVYLLLAVLSFAGRNWARIVLAVVSAGFVLLLLFGLVTGGATADTLLVLGVLLVLIVASVVIAFLPPSNAWYAHRR